MEELHNTLFPLNSQCLFHDLVSYFGPGVKHDNKTELGFLIIIQSKRQSAY